MSETNDYVPLWTLCSFDDDLLPDSTSPEYSFNYVDISNVETGRMEVPEQTFTFSEAPSRARRLAQPGDVAISTVRTYLRAIAPVPKTTQNLVLSTGFCIVRPLTSTTDGRFVNYLLTSNQVVDEIVADSTGTSYPATSATKISRLRVPAPPLPTQRAIADYLDRETAEIDAMRADLDKMERLLEERQASLFRAVTGDESVEVGVGVTSLLITGSTPKGGRLGTKDRPENGLLWLRPEDLDDEHPSKAIKLTASESETVKVLPANTPLFCGIGATVGKTGFSDQKCATNQQITALVPQTGFDARYLFRALQSKQDEIRETAPSSTLKIVNNQRLSAQKIPFFPLPEQRRIADEIDRETAEIDSMLEDITKLRDLLVERRSAVISAAVTGEIDIPVSLDDKDEPHA